MHSLKKRLLVSHGSTGEYSVSTVSFPAKAKPHETMACVDPGKIADAHWPDELMDEWGWGKRPQLCLDPWFIYEALGFSVFCASSTLQNF